MPERHQATPAPADENSTPAADPAPAPTNLAGIPDEVTVRPITFADLLKFNAGDRLWIADVGTLTPAIALAPSGRTRDTTAVFKDVKNPERHSTEVIGVYGKLEYRTMFGSESTVTLAQSERVATAMAGDMVRNIWHRPPTAFITCEPNHPDAFTAPVTRIVGYQVTVTVLVPNTDRNANPDQVAQDFLDQFGPDTTDDPVQVWSAKARPIAAKYVDVFDLEQSHQHARGVLRDRAWEFVPSADRRTFSTIPIPDHLLDTPTPSDPRLFGTSSSHL